MIEVVSGIIVRQGRILLTQRRSTQDFPLTWECPGGKVKDGESFHGALRRELDEELGIMAGEIPIAPFLAQDLRPVADVHQIFYVVPLHLGAPRPLEGQGIGWFTPDEFLGLSLTPGNAKAFDQIRDFLRERATERSREVGRQRRAEIDRLRADLDEHEQECATCAPFWEAATETGCFAYEDHCREGKRLMDRVHDLEKARRG